MATLRTALDTLSIEPIILHVPAVANTLLGELAFQALLHEPHASASY